MLIVEDDPHIGESLGRALEGTGYRATWVSTGAEALAAVAADPVDLVLLDLGLPDADGLDLCRQIHDADPAATVVILTARDEELDIVVGLDAGAVDYITKPFKLAELLARVRAQLRRSDPGRTGTRAVGDLRIDDGARRAWIVEEEIDLRPKEFDLLSRLLRDVGDAVTRETLMADVWDEHWFGSTKTLDFHVAALRRKIDRGDGPSRITTLRGVGYRLERR
ncbi:MAG: DNA-binding response regulator [Acidimicrobiales bacterium]|nr:DNA-binding response regulator [Acidimicrobiales bacterium]